MINLVITSLMQGLLAAALSALGMWGTVMFFEWRERCE